MERNRQSTGVRAKSVKPPGRARGRGFHSCLLLICAAIGLSMPANVQSGDVVREKLVKAGTPTSALTPAERGFQFLTTKPYLPADFDQETFDRLWERWPAPEKEKAQRATPAERRRMTMAYYGLMPRPDRPNAGPALGYVDDGKQGWVMNCLACHTGKVAGRVVLGVGNSNYALQTLTEDVRLTKLQTRKGLAHLDLASLQLPLGGSDGTTNSVIFGVALGNLRDKHLNVGVPREVDPVLVHHDMDAPPFWNVRKKRTLYADGFAAKGHRPLLQFVMLPCNSGEQLKEWEPDYRDILAWIELLRPPKYPYAINRELAAQGEVTFNAHCAECHGTYGENPEFPNRIVPINIVQTDPLRLRSLTVGHRRFMRDGWFGEYGTKPYEVDPKGYVAPPLDGIWASAPYFHNGSVPTLWHLLHSDARPMVWKRTPDGYDQSRVGLEMESLSDLPVSATTPAAKRRYFDTRLPGKSAGGHRFPDKLTEAEKRAVLEYLKTL